jgi:hypothetical protein
MGKFPSTVVGEEPTENSRSSVQIRARKRIREFDLFPILAIGATRSSAVIGARWR